MTKAELIQAIAVGADLPKTTVTVIIDALISTLTTELKAGNPVTLFGLGTFNVRDRPARTGRNPQTGESMMIAAMKVAGFKAAKSLKDSINNSPSLSDGGSV